MEDQKEGKTQQQKPYIKRPPLPPTAEFPAGNPTGVWGAARVTAGNSLKKSLDLGVWGVGAYVHRGVGGSRVVPHQDQGGGREAAALLPPLGQLGLGWWGQTQAA